MIAARFRLVGWVVGCAGAALCCYLASQSVAAERGALARVDSEIVDTRADIDKLATEITARSRAGQVERWNGVLALQAARPVQYASSGVQLASLAGGARLALDPAVVASHGAIDTVAYQPAPPVAVPAAAPPAPLGHDPLLHSASYVRSTSSRFADDEAPALVRASLEKPAPARREAARALPAKPRLARVEAKAGLSLLPDDFGKLIAAERKTKTSKSAL